MARAPAGRGGSAGPAGGEHAAADATIRPTPDGDPAAGLDGLMRMDVGTLEEMLPQILDAIAAGPLVLTRHGREFAVLLPLDAYRRLWDRAAEPAPQSPPPLVIEGEATRRD